MCSYHQSNQHQRRKNRRLKTEKETKNPTTTSIAMNCFKRSNVLLLAGALLCLLAVAVSVSAEDQLGDEDLKVIAKWRAAIADLVKNKLEWEYSPKTATRRMYAIHEFIDPLKSLADDIAASEAFKSNRKVREAVRQLFEQNYDNIYQYKNWLGQDLLSYHSDVSYRFKRV